MLRILVVDDEALLREVLSERLVTQLGATVLTACSGNQAIKLIEMGSKFDVIVSDYTMPDGTGVDLLSYVTQKNIPTMFVLFTGSTNLELPPTNNLFLGVIEKPNNNKLLETIIRGVETVGCLGSGKALTLNEPATSIG